MLLRIRPIILGNCTRKKTYLHKYLSLGRYDVKTPAW